MSAAEWQIEKKDRLLALASPSPLLSAALNLRSLKHANQSELTSDGHRDLRLRQCSSCGVPWICGWTLSVSEDREKHSLNYCCKQCSEIEIIQVPAYKVRQGGLGSNQSTGEVSNVSKAKQKGSRASLKKMLQQKQKSLGLMDMMKSL